MQPANTNSKPPEYSDYLDGFIDEKTAADFLCQSARTLQKWRLIGSGPMYYKPAGSVRYRRRDLNEWSENGRRRHTSDDAAA